MNNNTQNHDEFMYQMLLRRACDQLWLAQQFELLGLVDLAKKIRTQIIETEKLMSLHKDMIDQQRSKE